MIKEPFRQRIIRRLCIKLTSQKSPLRPAQVKIPVVYTMGKVASSALTAGFNQAGLPCSQIHNLDIEVLVALAKPSIDAGHFPLKHVSQSMAYKQDYNTFPERFLFISVARDPIARNISAFFQNLYITEQESGVETDIDVLFERFRKTYTHTLPLRWFDKQFGAYLGVDIYKYTFDTQKKLLHLPKENTVLFPIDCLRSDKEALLSNIFDRPIFIPETNVGEKKKYAARYKAFKAQARFDGAFLDQIYESRYCRYFWTDQERATMRAEWAE